MGYHILPCSLFLKPLIKKKRLIMLSMCLFGRNFESHISLINMYIIPNHILICLEHILSLFVAAVMQHKLVIWQTVFIMGFDTTKASTIKLFPVQD